MKKRSVKAILTILIISISVGQAIHAQTSILKITQGIYFKTSSPIYEGEADNFDFWFEIKNTGTSNLYYNDLRVAVHDANGNFLRDHYIVGPVGIDAGGTRIIREDPSTITEPAGHYQLVAKINYQGNWYDISPYSSAQYNPVWFEVVEKPTPPTGVTASDGSYISRITIQWNFVSGASHYRVYRNTTNNSSGAIALGVWQEGLTYNDYSATVCQTYYYWVKAATSSSGDNATDFSFPDSGWRALTYPVNVQASDGTYEDHINITWNSVTDANYYRVYRNTSDNSGGSTALGNWQSSNSFNDYNITPNQNYYYWVKASTVNDDYRTSAFSTSDVGYAYMPTSPPPTVTLNIPNNGEFYVGSNMFFEWESTNQHHFGLYLLKGNQEVGIITIENPSSNKYYEWTITPTINDVNGNTFTIEDGTDYQIGIAVWNADADSAGDESDHYLTIKNSPPCLFDDLLASHWGYNAIQYLCARSIVHGDEYTNTIRPDDPIKRAELAKVAYLGAGIDNASYADSYPSPFNDLQDENVWYYYFVKNLCYLEYDDGVSPFNRDDKGHFNFFPANNIERRHVLKVLLETFNIQPSATSVPFNDVYQITPEDIALYPYICKAYDLGIIYYNAQTHPNFRPYDNATRAEAFQMLYQTLLLIETGEIPAPNPQPGDFFVTGNHTPFNFNARKGLDTGNFNLYTKSSFVIPGRNVSLDFAHSYNSYTTELPGEFYPLKPLGTGWTHTYNCYIIETPESLDKEGNTVGKPSLLVFWPNSTMEVFDNTDTPVNPSPITKGVYDVMTRKSSTQYTVKKKNQVVYTFDLKTSDPKLYVLTSIKDRNNNALVITYEIIVDGILRVKEVTDPVGRKLRFSYYSGTNFLYQVSDPLNRNIQFNYTDGQLTSFTDAKNQTATYNYGTSAQETNLLKTIQLPKGNIITNDYAQRKMVSTQFNNTAPTTVNITPNYSDPQAVDYIKSTVVVPNPNNQDVTYYYEFNKQRNLTHLSGPPGINITCQYNDPNNPVKPTDVIDRGVSYHIVYDTMGNPTQTSKTDGSTTISESFEYNILNDITQFTDPEDNNTFFTYTDGNLTKIKDQLNYETNITYNQYGQVETITNPSSVVMQYGYNSYGNRGSITIPALGISSSMTYDVSSRLSTVTDFNNRTNSYNYDNNDNLTKITDALNYETLFTYDANDNLTAVTNARNRITTMDYFFDTDFLKKVDFEGYAKQYTYNDDGSINTFTTPNTHTFYYTYDNSGRITNDGYASYTYDSNDNLKTVTRGTNTITFDYDGFNRVSSIAYNDFTGNTVQYRYDKTNNVTKIIYPGNKEVNYTYDANYRMKTVTDWNNNTTIYDFRPDGQLSKVTYPNNVVCNYTYDNAGQLTGMSNVRNNGSGTIISSYDFTLDNVGNHLQESVTEPYSYPVLPSQTVNYTYTTTNRIQTAGSISFGFDNNGNTTSKTGYTFGYDVRNNLISVSGNLSASYTYDGAGNRRTLTKSSNTTRYVLDILGMSRVLMETDAGGSPGNYYVYGLGLISRIKSDNTTNYYFYDFRGSTIAMTDSTSSANITHKYAYDPFGNITNSEEADYNQFRYVGKYGVMYEDESLYFMHARYYDPEIGRFLGEDPIWHTNAYHYAANNPLLFIDPDGLELKVCSSTAFWDDSPFIHAYLYSTDLKRGEEMSSSFGSPGNDFRRNVDNNACNVVDNPNNVSEKKVLDTLAEIKNEGLWFPKYNDCHYKVNKALTTHGLKNPGAPGGRFKDNYLRNKTERAKVRILDWLYWGAAGSNRSIYELIRY